MFEHAGAPAIGCAGWQVRRDQGALFPSEGSHLWRYAQRFAAVEVNSTFYRPHRTATFERWKSQVPESFRFAVKAPKEITHERRLAGCAAALEAFLAQVAALGTSLGPILFQLPPSLQFDRRPAVRFLDMLRARFEGEVALEPRAASWFDKSADALLRKYRVARVAADPAVVPAAAAPGGWSGLVYYRLHGSPVMYASAYDLARLGALTEELKDTAKAVPTWCIFDNTRFGAAITDALQVLDHQQVHRPQARQLNENRM